MHLACYNFHVHRPISLIIFGRNVPEKVSNQMTICFPRPARRHCAKHCRVPTAWECRLHWVRHALPTARILILWITLFMEFRRSKSTGARSSTPLISWSRRSCWSGSHCHSTSLITASVNGYVVCSVSWQTHWTHVSLAVPTVKPLLLQAWWHISWSTFRRKSLVCIRRVKTRFHHS